MGVGGFSALALLVLLGMDDAASVVRFAPEPAVAAGEDVRAWGAQLLDEEGLAPGSCPLDLDASGLVVLDPATLLLYGSLRGGGGTFRSVLLRSGDGGRTWDETLSPQVGSSVSRVHFPSTSVGFAVVAWDVEGPGDQHVYRSRDSGRSWEHRSQVPKRDWNAEVVDIWFRDAERGQVVMQYLCSALFESDRDGEALLTLETSDGGRHWKERGRVCLAHCSTTSPREGSKDSPVYAVDRFWTVEELEESDLLRVIRSHSGDTGFDVIATLPRSWRRRADGTLEPCQRRPAP